MGGDSLPCGPSKENKKNPALWVATKIYWFHKFIVEILSAVSQIYHRDLSWSLYVSIPFVFFVIKFKVKKNFDLCQISLSGQWRKKRF